MPEPDFINDIFSNFNIGLKDIENKAIENSSKVTELNLFDPNEINMYKYQKGFNSFDFNPYDKTNYDRAVAKETWGSALSKGFSAMWKRFGNTYKMYWEDYGRMFTSLIEGDISKMLQSDEEAYKAYYLDQQEMLKSYVFVPEENKDDIFGKAGISELISNAGFSLGSIAGFMTEVLVDAAITAATVGGGAGSFAATGARVLTKLGFKGAAKAGVKSAAKAGVKSAAKAGVKGAAKHADDFFKGFFKLGNLDDIARATTKHAGDLDDLAKAGKNLNNMSKAGRQTIADGFDVLTYNVRGILKSKTAGEFFLNVGKGLPLIGSGIRHGERMVKAGKAGYSAMAIAGIGARGLQRMVQEYNQSSSEAVFEAIESYGSTLDMMLKEYHNSNDMGPTEFDFARMQELAMKTATRNYQTNVAVLLATNRIQFGSIYNKFPMHISWKMEKLFGELGEGILPVFSKKSGLKIYNTDKFLGGIRALRQIGKDFGWKKATWEGAKMFRKDFLKFEVMEGVQEILQEVSSSGWQHYYMGQYTDAETTLKEAFGKGLGEQWSKQGLKIFVHGAITGGIVRIPTHIMSRTVSASQKYINDISYGKKDNPIRQAEKQREEDINVVNAATWTADYNKSSISQLVNTLKNSIHMDEASENKDEYEWNNGKDNMMIQAAIAANRLGLDGAYVSAIRGMADDLTVDEFNKQLGIDITKTSHKTPKEFANSIASQVEKYGDAVSAIREDFQNLADPTQYNKDGMDYIVASIMRNKQEEAIGMIALMQLRGNRNIERVKKLKEEIGKVSGLEQSSQYALNVLTSLGGVETEMGYLKNRMLTINETLKLENLTKEEKEEYRKELKILKEREDDLKTWSSFFVKEKDGDNVKEVFLGEVITYDEDNGRVEHDTDSQKVKDLFRKIINNKNREEGLSEISEEAFQESGVKLIDIIKLTNDARDFMDSYSSLFQPGRFQQLQTKMVEGHLKFVLNNNLEYYLDVMDTNILRYLAKKFNIKDTELGKIIESISGKLNLNSGDEKKYIFQKAAMQELMDKNPEMKKEYKRVKKLLYSQLEKNEAYLEIMRLLSSEDDFNANIEKLTQLLGQVGNAIIAFDTMTLLDIDSDFMDQDLTPGTTKEKLTSDDIVRMAAKLEKGIELSPLEQEMYKDEDIKELVDKQRELIKEEVLKIEEDDPNIISEEELDNDFGEDEDEKIKKEEERLKKEEIEKEKAIEAEKKKALEAGRKLGLQTKTLMSISDESVVTFETILRGENVSVDSLNKLINDLYKEYNKVIGYKSSIEGVRNEFKLVSNYLEHLLITLLPMLEKQKETNESLNDKDKQKIIKEIQDKKVQINELLLENKEKSKLEKETSEREIEKVNTISKAIDNATEEQSKQQPSQTQQQSTATQQIADIERQRKELDKKVGSNIGFSEGSVGVILDDIDVTSSIVDNNGSRTITLKTKNGEIIGAISIGNEIDGYEGISINMNSKYQGKGLSKHLYNLALADAKERGLKGLFSVDNNLKTEHKSKATRKNFETSKADSNSNLVKQVSKQIINELKGDTAEITLITDVSDSFVKEGATKYNAELAEVAALEEQVKDDSQQTQNNEIKQEVEKLFDEKSVDDNIEEIEEISEITKDVEEEQNNATYARIKAEIIVEKIQELMGEEVIQNIESLTKQIEISILEGVNPANKTNDASMKMMDQKASKIIKENNLDSKEDVEIEKVEEKHPIINMDINDVSSVVDKISEDKEAIANQTSEILEQSKKIEKAEVKKEDILNILNRIKKINC